MYGAEGEIIDNDDDLKGYDKHKIYSQGGSLLVIMNKDNLDDLTPVPFSFADWRTRASRRVLHSTFSAEAQSAVETFGLARYYQAYMVDILLGHADWRPVDSYGEDELPIVLYTDCKSLFDNLRKEGSVPEDKWVAVAIASLRGAVSAGPGRNTSKSECRWVPSRWQLADCLTKRGLAAGFRERIDAGTTKLHELSLQEIKRAKTKQTNVVKSRQGNSVSVGDCHCCNYVSQFPTTRPLTMSHISQSGNPTGVPIAMTKRKKPNAKASPKWLCKNFDEADSPTSSGFADTVDENDRSPEPQMEEQDSGSSASHDV